jgi:hypothetical protein
MIGKVHSFQQFRLMGVWMICMSWLTEHFWCDLICLVCTWWKRAAAAGEKVWLVLNDRMPGHWNFHRYGLTKYWTARTYIAIKWAPYNLVGRANTDTATEAEGKGLARPRENEGSPELEGIPAMSTIHNRTQTPKGILKEN